MARQITRLIRGQQRAVRQNFWITVDLSPSALAGAGGSLFQGGLNAAADLLRPFTVVRTRVNMHVESDQVIASESAIGVLGFIVVTDQAVASGVAAIPSPLSQGDGAWFVYEPYFDAFLFGTGVGFLEPAGFSRMVDSKAMRKVGPNDDVAVIWQSQAASDGAFVSATGRMLVKLH